MFWLLVHFHSKNPLALTWERQEYWGRVVVVEDREILQYIS